MVILVLREKQDPEDFQDCLVYLDLPATQELRETAGILATQDQRVWVWKDLWDLLVFPDLPGHLESGSRVIKDVGVLRVNQVNEECPEAQVLLDHLDTASSVTLWPNRQTDKGPRRDLKLYSKAAILSYIKVAFFVSIKAFNFL